MKKVITYGSFDLIHIGHINILKRAKAWGDHLIVALSTDEFNRMKGKESFFSYKERKLILESIRYVDLVIPEKNWDQKLDDIKDYQIDTFIMGNDWEGKFDYLKDYCQVIYLPRTPGISTTIIKDKMNKPGIKNMSNGK